MIGPVRRLSGSLSGYVNNKAVRWRTGTRDGQISVLIGLVAVMLVMTAISVMDYVLVPMASFFLPMLIGYMMLRFKPLVVLMTIGMSAIVLTVSVAGASTIRIYSVALIAVGVGILLFDSRRRNQSGLPGGMGESMLVDLRDRLQSQSRIKNLPPGWSAQSSLLTAGGVNFAGDFVVSVTSDDARRLDVVLVDVSGKGAAAATRSLHLAGALAGLLGALPPIELFRVANQFLLRQNWHEGFATAVHLVLDLQTGEYTIVNAGHPPALVWDRSWTEWGVDGARGLALGIVPDPQFTVSTGVLGEGDALMLYTDGVTEGHSPDPSEAIAWLVAQADGAVTRSGFDGLPKRLLSLVDRPDDDRAIVVIAREASATPGAHTGMGAL